MKILCVHNYYGSSAPSGENTVFENEAELLQSRGNKVARFHRNSDEIRTRGLFGAFKGALSTPWNPISFFAIRHEVARFMPDVVHVHNTFPLLSPSIFYGIGQKAARVLTLHNYRLYCPAAIPMRNGRICTECMDRRSSLQAICYRCYRDSHIATAPLALSVSLHRRIGTWMRQVDAFIALTEFQKNIMINAGLPSERVHIKPNFYAGNPNPIAWDKRSSYVIFAGRLSIEKGVKDLLKAWIIWGESAPELRILGDGPLMDTLKKLAMASPGQRIQFLGQMSSIAAERQIAGAKLLVLPSICYEGFPMTIREAFAYGTPVAVTDIGPLPSIVNDGVSGLVFKPHDPASLLDKLRSAWKTPMLLERLGAGAYNEFVKHYNEKKNYEKLIEIYLAAISNRIM